MQGLSTEPWHMHETCPSIPSDDASHIIDFFVLRHKKFFQIGAGKCYFQYSSDRSAILLESNPIDR
ncbi:hypothetical protein ALO97_05249 [Pseudomonas syringae pv. tagetis]|uniref:Uncharacterized protein n=2 Tax=Pseudomonas syringae group genomosp. 7 TaxID=251699 RepID=A0A0Q0AYJ2_9PSED|nr:Uncharacterized protein ALO44_02871 [Pseudomonas syringae pv. tagetis]RMW25599.1 hypothetical protein ALO97_05249 [Pseudomonas syringae pv. tagetis]